MNNKIQSLLKKVLILGLVCGILIFSIVLLNFQHIDMCQNSHCCLCYAINFSQKVVMVIIVAVVLSSIVLFFISFFMADSYVFAKKSVFALNTLVSRKIQINE